LTFFVYIISISIGSFSEPIASSFIRFPLGYPGAIGIDQNYNLYYLDNTYSRLKVYDRKGHFLRSWYVTTPGLTEKPKRLIIEDNGHIYVETGYVRENPNKILCTVYNQSGTIIEEDSEKYADLYDFSAYMVTDAEGNIFKANKSSFFPKVIKINPSGQKYTVISDPFYLRIFAVAPNFVLFIVSMLLAAYLGWEIKRFPKKTDCQQGTKKE
jgi:hypothetical protein